MEEIEYEERIVVFIDILGFKTIVQESHKNTELKDLIYETLIFLKKREIPTKWNLQLIEIEEDAQKRNLSSFEIDTKTLCTSFSDSIVISVKYNSKNINEIFSTLIANISFIGAKLITKGILFRGGITTGKLFHSDDGIIFGEGLIQAYQLETQAAIYPRIILSKKIIKKLNYPLESKKNRYPYHQYIKRYTDGCVGLNQIIYFQVLQSWDKMSEKNLLNGLKKAKNTIIKGLDNNFENPNIFQKYIWLKKEYEDLIITNCEKPIFYNLTENVSIKNIHYSYSEKINNRR